MTEALSQLTEKQVSSSPPANPFAGELEYDLPEDDELTLIDDIRQKVDNYTRNNLESIVDSPDSRAEKKINCSYQELRQELRNAKTQDFTPKEILIWLIAQFEQQSTIEFQLSNNQILALWRCIEAYHRSGPDSIKGLFTEMQTSEGKSSVVIPLFVAYVALFEDHIHLHTVNPHLVEELTRLVGSFFNHGLASPNMVQVLSLRDLHQWLASRGDHHPSPLDSPILVGYWADFIHAYQFSFQQFLTDDAEEFAFPINALVICDEIDHILKDEALTPAIISTSLPTDQVVNDIVHMMEDIRGDSNQTSVDVSGLKTVHNQTVESPQDLYRLITWAIAIIEGYLGNDKEERGLSRHNSSLMLFLSSHLSEILTDGILGQQVNDPDGMFDWDLPEFQEAVLAAALLEEGVDYQILADGTIKPLAQTGFVDIGKEFSDFLQLALYAKHGKEWPKNIQSGLPTDRLMTPAFYQLFPRLFGFSATIMSVAERLEAQFGVETTSIAPTKQSIRKESLQLVASNQEKFDFVLARVLQADETRNTILVMASAKEAQAAMAELKKHQPAIDVGLLTADNQSMVRQALTWLSQKGPGGQRWVLVTARMLGRGAEVPLTPMIKEEGLLLVSAMPLESLRQYRQLVGRVGRQGTKAEAVVCLSLGDEIFHRLPKSLRKKLEEKIKGSTEPGESRVLSRLLYGLRRKFEGLFSENELEDLLQVCWESLENQSVIIAANQSVLNKYINALRRMLIADDLSFSVLADNLFVRFVHLVKKEPALWQIFLDEVEKKYDITLSAGALVNQPANRDERALDTVRQVAQILVTDYGNMEREEIFNKYLHPKKN